MRHSPKVAHWDDERSVGNSLIVTLKLGYEFGTDSFNPEHVRGFDSVSEARVAVRQAIRCRCKECSVSTPSVCYKTVHK